MHLGAGETSGSRDASADTDYEDEQLTPQRFHGVGAYADR